MNRRTLRITAISAAVAVTAIAAVVAGVLVTGSQSPQAESTAPPATLATVAQAPSEPPSSNSEEAPADTTDPRAAQVPEEQFAEDNVHVFDSSVGAPDQQDKTDAETRATEGLVAWLTYDSKEPAEDRAKRLEPWFPSGEPPESILVNPTGDRDWLPGAETKIEVLSTGVARMLYLPEQPQDYYWYEVRVNIQADWPNEYTRWHRYYGQDLPWKVGVPFKVEGGNFILDTSRDFLIIEPDEFPGTNF